MIENVYVSETNERALIYCILKKEEYLLDVIEQLDLDSFVSSCKNIYKVILDYFESGDKVVIEAILSRLNQDDNNYLLDILLESFNIDNFKIFFDIVKNKALIRKCKKISNDINEKLTTGISGIEILDYLQNQTDTLSNSISSSIDLFGNNLFDVIPNPDTYSPDQKREFIGISSGIKKLDEYTLGFHSGCFTIIAARPSDGKSLFLRQIFINNLLKGIPVLLFSIDESDALIKMKTVSTITGINYNHLKKQELNTQELSSLKKNMKIIQELPFIIDNNSDLTITSMRAKIKKILYKYPNLGAIGIDYIQQMGTTTEDITRVSQGLKKIAGHFKIPLFAISQLSRNIENRAYENEERWTDFPLLSDLKQSGALEADVDKAIFIRAEPRKTDDGSFKGKRKTRFFILKQRDNIAGVYFDMNTIGATQTLEEIHNEQTILNF